MWLSVDHPETCVRHRDDDVLVPHLDAEIAVIRHRADPSAKMAPHTAKVLNSTEDAYVESMSTFEVDEHLQERGLLPLLPRLGRMAANGDRTDTVPLRLISLPCH